MAGNQLGRRGGRAPRNACRPRDARIATPAPRRLARARALAAGAVGVAVLAGAASGAPAPPVAETGSGALRGSWQDGVAVFQGVPYARPPLGPLRWRPPEPAPAWKGVRDATAYGPECPQSLRMGETVGRVLEAQGVGWFRRLLVRSFMGMVAVPQRAEDCLYLNVRTAGLGGADPRPVMVWIHGGAHRNGSGSMRAYQTDALVERGAVLVTINYRLGVLGFLAHPGLSAESPHRSSGNYGLLDQIAALRWVRDHIAAFGGDPQRVAVFGQSAGAHAVGQLMASPLARGLFQRAIAQSGSGAHLLLHLRQPSPGLPAAERAGVELAHALGAPEAADPVAALRALDPETLIAASAADGPGHPAHHPVVDGWALPRPVAAIFAAGEQAPVPLLVGSTADEGSLLYSDRPPGSRSPLREVPPPVETLAQYRAALQRAFGPDAERVLALYPAAGDGDVPAATAALYGDASFGANARYLARMQRRRGQPAYLYLFTRTPPGRGARAGAFHGADVPFVFGLSSRLIPSRPGDPELTRAIGDYWVAFARSGDPNGAGRPAWPVFDPAGPRLLELGEQIRAIPVPRAAAYDLFDRRRERLLGQLMSTLGAW